MHQVMFLKDGVWRSSDFEFYNIWRVGSGKTAYTAVMVLKNVKPYTMELNMLMAWEK